MHQSNPLLLGQVLHMLFTCLTQRYICIYICTIYIHIALVLCPIVLDIDKVKLTGLVMKNL